MPTQSSQKPRRVRVKGATGVYYRPLPGGGRRYEVGYLDSDKVQRWEVVDGGVEDAKAYRADVVAKLGRGETVRKTDETVADYARAWLERQRPRLRRRTHEGYRNAIEHHIIPALGSKRLREVRVDDVADLVAKMTADEKAGWTIKGTLTPLGRVFAAAVRAGLITSNPVRGLDKDERPRIERREMRVLDADEIRALIAATPERYRLLVELSVLTGLRQSEALGLVWADLDLDGSRLRVRKQLDRNGERVEPKTETAKRTLRLPPSLVRHLRDHRERAFALGQARPEDFVFRTATGRPMAHRNVVRRGLGKAIDAASLNGDGRPKLTWHSLRHTHASMLIAKRLAVTYVAHRLGHASPTITLGTYGHLWNEAEDDELATDALEAVLVGKVEENGGGERLRTAAPPEAENVALLRASASGGD